MLVLNCVRACFHLHGYMNTQNSGCRSAENPALILAVPIHDVGVVV